MTLHEFYNASASAEHVEGRDTVSIYDRDARLRIRDNAKRRWSSS